MRCPTQAQYDRTKSYKDVSIFNEKFKVGNKVLYFDSSQQNPKPLKTKTLTESFSQNNIAVAYLMDKDGIALCRDIFPDTGVIPDEPL
jgi:hypothetical protein